VEQTFNSGTKVDECKRVSDNRYMASGTMAFAYATSKQSIIIVPKRFPAMSAGH
jgi:hypothetical protein